MQSRFIVEGEKKDDSSSVFSSRKLFIILSVSLPNPPPSSAPATDREER